MVGGISQVVALTPVTKLPKRLRTAFCWGGHSEFSPPDALPSPTTNSTAASASIAQSVKVWRALGFNAVPDDGADTYIPGPHSSS